MHHEIIDSQTGQPNKYYVFAAIFLWLAETLRNISAYEIPLIIMQLFQIFAWSAAGLSCIIGLYLNWKRGKKNKFHDPN